MEAQTVLKEYKAKIDERLNAFFDQKIKRAKEIDPFTAELIQNLKEYSLRGGKKIRPILAVFGFKCLNEGNEEAILNVAISLELLHDFLIMHDDIMDEDVLRRGGPTFHKLYEEVCRQKFPGFRAGRFGQGMGIVGGDILHAFGAEVIMKADFPAGIKQKALDKYNDIVYFTSLGQLLDMANEAKESVTERDILLVHELKTARYTIEGPLHLGAILAKAQPEHLKVLSAYGLPLGQAFQIRDDILGLYGEKQKLGKPVDSDLKEGKKTLLILKALEKASPEERQTILAALGNQKLKPAEADKVRTIIKKTGSLAYSQKLVESLVAQAREAMTQSQFNPQAKAFLLSLADYLLKREH